MYIFKAKSLPFGYTLRMLGLYFCIFNGLSSCGDSFVGANYVSFELDGVFWESFEADARGSFIGGSLISINFTARNDAGEAIQIEIFDTDPNAIEYVLSLNNRISYAPSGSIGGADTYSSINCAISSGGIILNERNINSVSGTFNARICLSGGEEKQIRNGQFIQVFF